VRAWVVGGLLLAAVGGAGLGVAQAYGLEWSLLADTRPPGGTFGNRNFLAHFAMLSVAPLAALALTSRRNLARVLATAGLAVVVAAAVLTRSRAAWLGGLGGLGAAGVVLVVAAIADRRGRADASGSTGEARDTVGAPSRSGLTVGRSAFVAVTLAIAVAVAVLLPNRLNWTTDSPYTETLSRIVEAGEGSGRGRIIQYKNSLEMVKHDPLLGVGPGNWFVQYPEVTTDGDPSFAGHLSIPTNPWPSSDWVAFLTERGPLGTLLLLAAGVLMVGRSLTRLRRSGANGETGRVHARGAEDIHFPGGSDLRYADRGFARDAHSSSLGVSGDAREARSAPLTEPAYATAASGTSPAGAAAAVVGLLVAALVMGMFDAVLLLPAPSFFVWTIVGVLLPDPARIREWLPSPGLRRSLRLAAVVLVGLLIAEASLHAAAIVTTHSSRSRATLAAAVRLAPGEHRLQLLLAERGSCPAARRAAALLPHHASAQRLAKRC
jgi:hypothetical protein